MLITAGPTHEPIDRVRFIGNRSSGRVGIALAEAAAAAGWQVTLLLGPTSRLCSDSRVHVERFQSTSDLQALLAHHFPITDVLIMAAAVADYRPLTSAAASEADGKLRRLGEGGKASGDSSGKGSLTIHLESTPDLLAGCARSRRPAQVLVGFALEPRSRLLESARAKLARKDVDMIVANPLESMEGETIEATLVARDGREARTPGTISKVEFAHWLLGQIVPAGASRSAQPPAPSA
ncbi:MAG: phosphopantothenoylcysteine decarboxylase [Phycisphaerales bacterium]